MFVFFFRYNSINNTLMATDNVQCHMKGPLDSCKIHDLGEKQSMCSMKKMTGGLM